MKCLMPEMEPGSFRVLFLDMEGEDGGIEDHFFPGSDEEFVIQEEEIEMYMNYYK